MSQQFIRIRGARQNNLKGFDLNLPLGKITVVTGPSGSGKSSLAFDTVYAEGQRRYVETFSPYARQFLDRQDRPRLDAIEGIPPAIAIDQVNPVRTSRSTVGTMTELADHLKLLYARAAALHCRGCGAPVRRDTPEAMATELLTCKEADVLMVTFEVRVPHNFSATEVQGFLEQQGYTRIHERRGNVIEVIQDRVRPAPANRARLTEALEAAFARGHGRLTVYPLDAERKPGKPWRYSTELHCAQCDIHYRDPTPGLFSFNSPAGACPTCRGFGRTQGIDYGLVIPDESKSLADGAVRPWQTKAFRECQRDLIRYAKQRGIPVGRPWRDLTEAQKRWVIDGEGRARDRVWYGAVRFFRWLESKSYRMHIRVLLARYRAYNPCPDCRGARLKPMRCSIPICASVRRGCNSTTRRSRRCRASRFTT